MVTPVNAPLSSHAGPDQFQRLSEALAIYNQAFRNHIGAVLRKNLGANWWQEGIVRRISGIQEAIEKSDLESSPPDEDALSLLEPKDYFWVVREHREHFPELDRAGSHRIAKIGGNPATLLHEVKDWRNVWAHRPPRLAPATVDRAVEAMVRLVRLFDPAAHAELSRLSRRSEQPVTARVPEHGPDTASQATAEAKRLVANAQESARRILAEAASDADDIKNAARAEAKALQAQAAKPGTGVRASGPTNFVSRESRDKLDRVQRRVRQLKDEDSKAQSELNSTRRQIMALRKRADAIKKEAQETRLSAQAEATAKAEQILRSARAEAEAIRLESRQSEAYQTLRRSALAQGERDAAALLEEARKEAEALMAKARKDANIVTREASANAEAVRKLAEERTEKIRGDTEAAIKATTAETRLTLDQAERTEKAPGDASESATPAARTGRADGPTAANQLRRRPDLNQASQRNFRQRFKPARSGNGHIRSLNVDGWRLNLWVGMTNGLPRASAFAPSKTVNGRRVEARDAPLMESVCSSEEAAFEWLREREESGLIRREARLAIRLFEREEADDESDSWSNALDDDIPF